MHSSLRRLSSLALVLVPLCVLAEPDSATEMTFEGGVLNTVHESNLRFIAAGRLATARGGSVAIQQFGADVVTDHGLADEQIIALAARTNVILPSTAAPEGDSLQQLAILSGDAFDRAFLKMMVDDNDKAIVMVQSAQPRVSSAPLTAFLKSFLSTLQKHRETALALSKSFRAQR
jgi:putative membrane protein